MAVDVPGNYRLLGQTRDAFLHAGGREFHYIPALNDDPDWIRALVSLVQQYLQS